MGPLTLPTSGLVYLDANGLIYSVERVEPYRTLLQPMWEQEADMELYQLDYVLHEPREDQGWLYMAEIPELPGCRAWGENADETLSELSTVAKQFILSYKDRGKSLPTGVARSLTGRGK